MRFFLLLFFLIYGAFHLYAFVKAKGVFRITGWRNLFAFMFILMMIAMPVITRVSEHSGYELLAMVTAYVGYIWMGFLFFFVSTALFMDVVAVACVSTQWLFRFSPVKWPFSRKSALCIPVIIAFAACVYGVYEADDIRIETVTLETDKLPPDRDKLRIAQISDLHLGLIVREDKLNQVASKIESIHPDILVSTGDLVDGQLARLNGLSDIFRQINPPYGKFAVTGNHEFYVGINQSQDFTQKSGFQLLRGEFVHIENWLTVIGLDDQVAVRMGLGNDREDRLFDAVDSEKFVLLLKHRPTVNPENIRNVNLQLSGHIHKGQIFPFNLLVRLVYPIPIGLSSPAEGYSLYVSRGTGTWGPPFRVFSPPEITVIDLVKINTSHIH